jgi:hypothetical protein
LRLTPRGSGLIWFWGGKLTLTPQIETAAEALALTEWKVVRNPAEFPAKADEAYKQAKLYGVGTLAGFELQTKRYLVLVSSGRLEMPADRVDSGIAYERVNIAVKPSVPSKQSNN